MRKSPSVKLHCQNKGHELTVFQKMQSRATGKTPNGNSLTPRYSMEQEKGSMLKDVKPQAVEWNGGRPAKHMDTSRAWHTTVFNRGTVV
jgi:hypothetical protein